MSPNEPVMKSYRKEPHVDVTERIRQRYASMSGALRAFADFVLEEPVAAARLSIHAAVKEAGVSVATANRFATALGFKNYPGFRSALIQSFASAFEPVKQLEAEVSRASTSQEIIANSLKEDIDNIQQTVAAINFDSSAEAVRMILGARRIMITGFDNGAALAQIFVNGLTPLKDHVVTPGINGSGFSGARHLAGMGGSDLVVAIAFPRYVKDTVRLAFTAAGLNVPVLAITDDHHSPLAAHATLSLFVGAHRKFASSSNTAALALIEALLAAVTHLTPDSVRFAERFTEIALPWIETKD